VYRVGIAVLFIGPVLIVRGMNLGLNIVKIKNVDHLIGIKKE